MTTSEGGHTAAGFFSPAGAFFANFKLPECPCALVKIPFSVPRLMAARSWDTSADQATSTRGHGGDKEIGGRCGRDWTYLTLECRAGDLVVALDVLLDGLARGTVAFFELQKSADDDQTFTLNKAR